MEDEFIGMIWSQGMICSAFNAISRTLAEVGSPSGLTPEQKVTLRDTYRTLGTIIDEIDMKIVDKKFPKK